MTDLAGGARNGEVEKADLGEVGISGVRQYGGVLNEDYLPGLTGPQARKTQREMSDNDPTVGAVLFGIDMLMRQVETRVEPAAEWDDEQQAQDYAEFVEGALGDMSISWEDTLSSWLSFLPYGWSYSEIVYKRRMGADQTDGSKRSRYSDGLYGWRKFALRPQETLLRWDFDENGGVRAMVQHDDLGNEVPVPIEKALHFRTSLARGSPEGRSVLRNAWRPWYMKKRIEEIEAVGIERDLAGFPVIYVPGKLFASTATAAEQAVLQAWKEIGRDIKRDQQEGLVMPLVFDEKTGNPLYRMELLSTGGRRQFDTDAVIGRYDQRIAMTLLADFILLGHEKVGSFALGASKIDLFTTALTAWLDELYAVFNSYAIPRLMKLNGWEQAASPTVEHADITPVDLEELGVYLQRLGSTGMELFPDDELENDLRQKARLPLKPVGEEEIGTGTTELPSADEAQGTDEDEEVGEGVTADSG